MLARLAGYDWVPETKLTRSLRESWQRDRPGQTHLQRDNRALTGWDSGGFGGYVQLLHM